MPFDYYPFIGVHPKAPSRPRLLIRVIGPKNENKTNAFAFIDTGANWCFFPRSLAKQLKIKWRKGEKINVHDAAGKRRRGYKHYLSIEFFGIQLDSIPPENILFTDEPILQLNEIPIVFVSHLKEPILGVAGFLDRYVYTMNHAKSRYSVCTALKERACEICRPGK